MLPSSKTSTIILINIIILISILIDLNNTNSILSIPLISSITCSFIITKLGIKQFKKFKLKQFIRKEGPQGHQKKQGTPTMGGLLVIPVGLIIGNIINMNTTNNEQFIPITFLAIAYMLIGAIDDWNALNNQKNAGLSPKAKITYQIIFGMIFIMWIYLKGFIKSDISLVFEQSINIGIFILPLALFVLLAQSNSTNLTDGLDGLASGCGSLVFTGLAVQLMLRNNVIDNSTASFSMALAGSWLGFLLHNKNPAKIFMGDTGSLGMGASLAGIALVSDNLWSLFIMSGVFIAESLSVIIQVGIYKITKFSQGEGKRVFLMAPLHHHFEQKGANEVSIVNSFWLITLVFICLSLLFRSIPN